MNDAKVTWMRERYGDSLVQYGEIWTERATRTAPIQPETIVPAIEALYRAASLNKPRVVIVPSPGVMAFAGMFAAAIWEKRKTNPEYDPAQGLSDAGQAVQRNAAEAVRKATQDPTNVSECDDVAAATLEATYGPADLATVNALDPDRWRDIREAMQEFDALLYADECIRDAMRDPFGNNKLTEMMAWAMQEWGQTLAEHMFSSKEDAQHVLGKVADWWQHSQAGNTKLYWTSVSCGKRC
ncbi:MAG: hypothetical protein IPJ25_01440 [Rhodocyclaceae bacterium]|nr:hypothetical protein [Rhodocyclaceae bacterium]